MRASNGSVKYRSRLIWSSPPSHAACRSATLAGIIPNQDSHDLALIYEPEAAALTACSQANVTVEAGEVFLIVDAGGGTVDFTMHVVEMQNGRKVLSEATYRACLLQGSKKLDSNFEDFIAQLVDEDVYDAWYSEHPSGEWARWQAGPSSWLHVNTFCHPLWSSVHSQLIGAPVPLLHVCRPTAAGVQRVGAAQEELQRQHAAGRERDQAAAVAGARHASRRTQAGPRPQRLLGQAEADGLRGGGHLRPDSQQHPGGELRRWIATSGLWIATSVPATAASHVSW